MYKKDEIRFTAHVEEKLIRLDKILNTIQNPEKIVEGYGGCKIAQRALTSQLLIRVVYREIKEEILVITAYPSERWRY